MTTTIEGEVARGECVILREKRLADAEDDFRWRTDAELTQRDLARLLRKPHSYVHKVEVGDRRVDPLEFVAWCVACGIDPCRAIRRIQIRD